MGGGKPTPAAVAPLKRAGWCTLICECCGNASTTLCSHLAKGTVCARACGDDCVPDGWWSCILGKGEGCAKYTKWACCLAPVHLAAGLLSAHTLLIGLGMRIGPAFVAVSAAVLLAVACVPRCMNAGTNFDEAVRRYTFRAGTATAVLLLGFAFGAWIFSNARDDLSDGANAALYVLTAGVWLVLVGVFWVWTGGMDGTCSSLQLWRAPLACCGDTGPASEDGDGGGAGDFETPANANASAAETDRAALLPPLILSIRR